MKNRLKKETTPSSGVASKGYKITSEYSSPVSFVNFQTENHDFEHISVILLRRFGELGAGRLIYQDGVSNRRGLWKQATSSNLTTPIVSGSFGGTQ